MLEKGTTWLDNQTLYSEINANSDQRDYTSDTAGHNYLSCLFSGLPTSPFQLSLLGEHQHDELPFLLHEGEVHQAVRPQAERRN